MQPPLPSPRQTQTFLRKLLADHGVEPKNKLGQNFLIDLNLLDVIVKAAELGPADLALEVGSGTGGLTCRLVGTAGAVVSVEIDPIFADVVRHVVESTGTDMSSVALLHADALRNKNELNPGMLETVTALMGSAGCSRVKLVANLPYAIATPVITNLLLTDLPIERMVVTVQWEIAERLTASPGTKDYGSLSVMVQSQARTSVLRKLPPAVFWPRPKVDSAIVLIQPDAALRERIRFNPPPGQPASGPRENRLRLRNFLRDLYAHRRKNLRGGLVSMAGRGLSKQDVDKGLADLGISGTTRAETLTIQQHLALCEVFG